MKSAWYGNHLYSNAILSQCESYTAGGRLGQGLHCGLYFSVIILLLCAYEPVPRLQALW